MRKTSINDFDKEVNRYFYDHKNNNTFLITDKGLFLLKEDTTTALKMGGVFGKASM